MTMKFAVVESASVAALPSANATATNSTQGGEGVVRRRRHKKKNQPQRDKEDMSLWIDKNQVKMFSGFAMEIFAIANGQVQPYILDPNFEEYLPVIPSTVGYVNFTWKSGSRKYFYHFDRLESFDQKVLESPVVSIDIKGRVPKKPKMFTVHLPCSGNATGVAGFSIGLNIQTRRGKSLPGTPLRLRLRKECTEIVGPDPECDKLCANGGWCNHEKICQCPEGYMGKYCTTVLCYPQCMNGGTCTGPGVCSCPPGFHGNHCEGGICQQKCLNNGKCVQKDTCSCPKGFYGSRCEFSKCVIPCLNGGRCKGVNVCRCPWGFRGDHCEVSVMGSSQSMSSLGTSSPALSGEGEDGSRPPQQQGEQLKDEGKKQALREAFCDRPCQNGFCVRNNRCKCTPGWFGKQCHRRNPRVRSAPVEGQQPQINPPFKRRKVWV